MKAVRAKLALKNGVGRDGAPMDELQASIIQMRLLGPLPLCHAELPAPARRG